jgi:deazaflavin-dependent oxidoreductase (nitroreductase family)
MANNWKTFGKVHKVLYKLSGGRFGHEMPDGRRILLLSTVGCRSGKRRTTPLVYMPDEDRFVVVASNGGAESDPAWWRNLEARPEAEVQAGARHVAVRARRADGAEADGIWPRACEYNDHWAGYRTHTQRAIPLVILEPREA